LADKCRRSGDCHLLWRLSISDRFLGGAMFVDAMLKSVYSSSASWSIGRVYGEHQYDSFSNHCTYQWSIIWTTCFNTLLQYFFSKAQAYRIGEVSLPELLLDYSNRWWPSFTTIRIEESVSIDYTDEITWS
jgi:hypothetical protein